MGLEKIKSQECMVLCSCEGTAEQETIEWLLDEDKLIFSRDQMIEKKCIKTRSAKNIERKYLSLDYDKEVVILRILDSKKDTFKLSKLFVDRFEMINCRTNPEIEILMIVHKGDYAKYRNKHSRTKPSDYAKKEYSIKNIKSSGTFKKFFSTIENLIDSIKEHKSKNGGNHLTIFDLLK